MSERGKKIFLALSIIVPFLLYCVYYYSIMIKNAPYRFSDFESVTFKYGTGDSLTNTYYSKTGEYRYANTKDSVVRVKVRLTNDELLYLHHKAAELGFWNFPDVLSGVNNPNHSKNVPRYYLEFKYKTKSKHMFFDADYYDNSKIADAAKQLTTEVNQYINDAESKRGKPF